MTTAFVDRALSIGADPRETADERFRRRLLVGVALIILPVAVVWGCLYWAIGEQGVALTPWAYATGSAISLAVFARTRNFATLRTAQQVLILVAPAEVDGCVYLRPCFVNYRTTDDDVRALVSVAREVGDGLYREAAGRSA